MDSISANGAEITEHLNVREMALHTTLTYFTKINSKWSIKLNVKFKTLKFLEENIGEILDDLGVRQNF